MGWVSGETIEETAKHSDIVKEDADREEKAKGKGFVLLAGWESLEAHMEFRETERFKENVGFIRGNHGGVEMVGWLLNRCVGRGLMRDSFMLGLRLLESSFWLFDTFHYTLKVKVAHRLYEIEKIEMLVLACSPYL